MMNGNGETRGEAGAYGPLCGLDKMADHRERTSIASARRRRHDGTKYFEKEGTRGKESIHNLTPESVDRNSCVMHRAIQASWA